MQTILGAGGSIGTELANELTAYTNKIRLVSRHPQKVNPTDELFPADLTNAEETDKAVAGSEIVYLVAGLEYKLSVWQHQWPELMRNVLDATRILAHRLTTDAVRVTVTDPATPLPALPPAVETAAYRITAEAVTNAVRHAGARGVEVTFTACPGALTVTVADDGTGFDAGAVPGTGLSSIAERAEEIGGAATIDTAPGGTTVTATLPTTLGDPHE